MSTYQTDKGWGVDYRDEWNRRHRHFAGSLDQATNMDKLLHQNAAEARKKLSSAKRTCTLDLATARDLYLAGLSSAPHTRANTAKYITAMINLVGNIPAADVTPAMLATYHQARSQRLNPNTLAIESMYIRNFFAFLCARWGLPTSPAANLPTARRRYSAGSPITHQQEAQALAHASTPRTRLKILLGLDAGLRSGELALIRLNAINHKDRELTIWPSKPGQPRTVPLTPRLYTALLDLIPKNPTTPDQHLFSFHYHPILRPSGTLDTLRKAGIAPFRFHDLRHTFSARLTETGTPAHVIRALLGHAPHTTTDLYLHATSPQKRAAIDQLDAYNQAALKQPQKNPPADTTTRANPEQDPDHQGTTPIPPTNLPQKKYTTLRQRLDNIRAAHQAAATEPLTKEST